MLQEQRRPKQLKKELNMDAGWWMLFWPQDVSAAEAAAVTLLFWDTVGSNDQAAVFAT